MEISVNGVSLFYQCSGQGTPLLLLHGNGEDHHIFDALALKLGAHFTVYAIDSRNHGQSQKTDDYAYETMAADVYAFIQALRLAPVDVVGFSDGAIISLILAMQHGDAVRKMSLLGVNLKPEDFTAESYEFVKGTYEQTGDPLFKLMLEQPQIELEAVRSVRVPTQLIAAEHDIYQPESFERLCRALPDATLKIMKGHEHDSYVVGQDLLYPDLMAFFA